MLRVYKASEIQRIKLDEHDGPTLDIKSDSTRLMYFRNTNTQWFSMRNPSNRSFDRFEIRFAPTKYSAMVYIPSCLAVYRHSAG